MSAVPTVWIEKKLIESFDVDILGRLRPQTLFAFLLNAAWNHANGSIYGYEELSTRNLIWVLIKMQILIKRLPKWREQIRIETWGKQKVRLYALRDFIVSSETGENLISAATSWMILDRSSGRPQRFDQKSDSLPWQSEKVAIETNLEKVQQLNSGKELARFRVHFSDIDVNRHVNSTKYLEWMIDCHSQKHLETKELKTLEMSFLSEAMANDEVTVYSEELNECELCSVRRTQDGKEICRGRLEWRTTA